MLTNLLRSDSHMLMAITDDPRIIVFYAADGSEVGRLIVEYTGMRFEGKADDSAAAFLSAVARMHGRGWWPQQAASAESKVDE